MTRVTLRNGLVVGNFSSPHPFRFDTGEVLDGVPADESRSLSIDRTENVVIGNDSRYTNMRIGFRMDQAVYNRLVDLEEDPSVDIVIVPLPVKTALEEGGCWKGISGKLRTCVLSDRVEKIISSTKFGV